MNTTQDILADLKTSPLKDAVKESNATPRTIYVVLKRNWVTKAEMAFLGSHPAFELASVPDKNVVLMFNK